MELPPGFDQYILDILVWAQGAMFVIFQHCSVVAAEFGFARFMSLLGDGLL